MARFSYALRRIVDFAIWLLAMVTALCGVGLLIEQSFLDIFAVEITLLAPWLALIATYLPLISLLVICTSIYIEHLPRTPPTWISKTVIAPLFVIVAVILFVVQLLSGTLEARYLSGTSLLALGGALLRVRGFPLEAHFPRDG